MQCGPHLFCGIQWYDFTEKTKTGTQTPFYGLELQDISWGEMDPSLVKVFEELKINFERSPCDTQKCKELVNQTKVRTVITFCTSY